MNETISASQMLLVNRPGMNCMSCLDGSGQTGAEFTVHEETFLFLRHLPLISQKRKKNQKKWLFVTQQKAFFPRRYQQEARQGLPDSRACSPGTEQG